MIFLNIIVLFIVENSSTCFYKKYPDNSFITRREIECSKVKYNQRNVFQQQKTYVNIGFKVIYSYIVNTTRRHVPNFYKVVQI